MIDPDVKRWLVSIAGPGNVLDSESDLRLYEYDGSVDKHRPEVVVFPKTTEQVVKIVNLARERGIPFVGRGAGTGLSGGVIPRAGGIMISFARMNRIVEIDLENERVVVEPGVVNLDVTLAVQNQKYFYAPDPSSQRACTIGGNVAENAGGPHTLAYGVTTNHVLGIEAVLPDGSVIECGGKGQDTPGYDLVGLLTGSEGTMVLVTKVILRLMHQPELV
ncbi:MAG: FAD-binding protein, partial [Acidobacteria bacterium]|nr:FAD-binding protein [Acidobacteriota bacterium]